MFQLSGPRRRPPRKGGISIVTVLSRYIRSPRNSLCRARSSINALVAATKRTLTLRWSRALPTGRIDIVSIARRSLACWASGNSPISSRNRGAPSAAWNRPTSLSVAPVKAPRYVQTIRIDELLRVAPRNSPRQMVAWRVGPRNAGLAQRVPAASCLARIKTGGPGSLPPGLAAFSAVVRFDPALQFQDSRGFADDLVEAAVHFLPLPQDGERLLARLLAQLVADQHDFLSATGFVR